MRNEHGWRTRTPDGAKREVRAHLFGGRWTLKARVQGDDEWTTYEEPLLEGLSKQSLIRDDRFVASVELGNELMSGSGTTWVQDFDVDVSPAG